MSDEQVSVLTFADYARRLGMEARKLGLKPPAFRCPGRDDPEQSRRLLRDGAVASVPLHGRTAEQLLDDMAWGVCAANGKGSDVTLHDQLVEAAS